MLGADPCAAFGRARTQGWLITAAGVRPTLEDVSMLQVCASLTSLSFSLTGGIWIFRPEHFAPRRAEPGLWRAVAAIVAAKLIMVMLSP